LGQNRVANILRNRGVINQVKKRKICAIVMQPFVFDSIITNDNALWRSYCTTIQPAVRWKFENGKKNNEQT
jgi:hypothetical protein